MWTSSGHLTGAQKLKFLLRHKELLQKYMPALVDLPDNSLAYELLLVRCKRMDSRAQLEAVRPDKSPRTVLQTPVGLFVGTPETDAILFLLSANSESHYLVTGSSGMGKSLLSRVSSGFEVRCCCAEALEFCPTKMSQFLIGISSSSSSKKILVVVDDLHTAGKEKYGAVPPMEVLVQAMASRHVVDRDKFHPLPQEGFMSFRVTAASLSKDSPINCARFINRVHHVDNA